MKQYGLIWMTCCTLLILNTRGQDFPRIKFSDLPTLNNLPPGNATTIFKDSKGLMWIGTESYGLLRFDGKQLISYQRTENRPNGIPSNFIASICEDKQGWLWISTLPGLYRLNPVTEEIEIYLHSDNDSNSIATNNKPIAFVDRKGHVLVSSNQGLQQFDPLRKKFIHYSLPEISNPAWQLHAKGVGMLYQDRNGRIWAGSAYGLYLVDTINHRCIPFFTGSYAYVSGILQDQQGQIWVSFWGGGLKKFYPETNRYIDFFKTNSVVRFLNEWEDEQHKRWICFAEDYLTLLDPATGKYTYYKDETLPANILAPSIYYIYRDNEQRLWISNNKGISIIDPGLQNFKIHSLQPAIQQFNLRISNTGIPAGFLKIPGGYFVSGWYNGYLYRLDSTFRVIDVIKKLSAFARTEYPGINNIQRDDKGNTWYATDSGLVEQSSRGIKYFIPKDIFLQTENRFKANEMLKRSDGLYWVRFASRGLYVFDAASGQFLRNYRNQYNGIATCIRFDRDNIPWLGTSAGLYKYDAVKDSFELVPLYKTKTIFNEWYHAIHDLYFDQKNTAWVATYFGLVSLSAGDRSINIITDKQKSPHYPAYKLLEDSTGTIWIAGDNGIRAFNKQKGEFRYFSNADGLPFDYNGDSNLFNWINDSTIAAGSLNSITTFNPYKLNNNIIKTGLVFTDFSIDEKRYFASSLNDSSRAIIIPAGSKKIQIHFALPNYAAPQQNRLYYRLVNGQGSDWIETKDGDINLLNLAAGAYTVQVRAISNESASTSIYNSIRFIIKPYWYQEKWWKTAVVLFVLLLLYAAVRWRIRSVKNSVILKQQIAETEIAALKAQMNPHFIFNCINSIDAFIHSNDKYNATLYLNKFAKLLRNILDSSKQNTVTFSKDIETLTLYIQLEELRHENKFTTTFTIADELLTNDYKVPPLIVQPFVENAILHGLKNREDNNGLLQISIKRLADTIEYCITDNGIGRKAAALVGQTKESSYGMQMSFDRIRLFNKEDNASVKITDLSENGIASGTEVKISLKIV